MDYINILNIVIILFVLSILYGIYELLCKKEKLKNVLKKVISSFVILSLITFILGIIVNKPVLVLNGDKIVNIPVFEEYTDTGAFVKNTININDYKINTINNININKVGTYNYVYSINYLWKTITTKRIINVIDTDKPTITLEGDETIIVYQNGIYEEPGYSAIDNYDGDLTEKVVVENNIGDEVGTYTIKYSVSDSSGNITTAIRNVERKLPTSGVIYFTFDDGPSNSTEKILDILDKYNIKATFFTLNFNESYEPIIKRMHESGHTVALHSYTHNYKYIYSSENAYFNDLKNIQNRVLSVTGVESKIIRFPGGSSNTVSSFNKGIMSRLVKQVNEKGYHYFDWNVDSSDAWSAKNSTDVYNNVISGIRKNRDNVVLMHDFSNNNKTIDALEKIIKKCINDGYSFKSITMDTPVVHHGIKN